MKEKIKQISRNMTLATKIRYSYLIILVPVIIVFSICFYSLWSGNRKYEEMINSAVVASQFSLDFKKDFDYETYLLIVENKSIKESGLNDLLQQANLVVNELEESTNSEENTSRLKSVKKYLKNLQTYKERIEQNLSVGNKYEDNIEIWEKDVQIVSSLIRESVLQYIYFEIKDIQQARSDYQNFYVTMIRISIISFGGIFLLIIILSYYVPQSITKPIKEISKVTDQVAKGDLTIRSKVSAGAEVGVLSQSLNSMIDKTNELLHQITREQSQLRKAELELLQSQINPHFLYNTLDTIVWLAEGGNQRQVVSMVKSLSEFFRKSLSQGKDVVLVKDELQHVRSYLEIQQVRYQDILEYDILVPKELYHFKIPKITIQPLVENALYHGIKNKRGKGKIIINGNMGEDCFCLYVKDDGIGMDKDRLKLVTDGLIHKSIEEKDIFGLYNVNERIRLKFGESYGIYIESSYMMGTVVCIKLPISLEGEK